MKEKYRQTLKSVQTQTRTNLNLNLTNIQTTTTLYWHTLDTTLN